MRQILYFVMQPCFLSLNDNTTSNAVSLPDGTVIPVRRIRRISLQLDLTLDRVLFVPQF